MRFWDRICCVAVVMTTLVAQALAQVYPSRPVRLVSAFPPGGPTDILARPIGEKLTESFGQPFVIDFRTGANGILGSDFVAKSAADGHTLLVIPGSFTTSPSTQKSLPYDVLRDFTGVSPLARGQILLITNPKLPVSNLKDLIAFAKANPGKLNYGSSGTGGSVHLGMEMLNLVADIKMTHIPYKGAGPALIDVIAGNADLMFIGASPAVPHIKTGKVRLLAAASPRRSAGFPDTPTVAETGFPNFEIGSNYGIIAAAATARPIIARINAAIEKALSNADVRKFYIGSGVEPWWDQPEQYTAWLREDVARWFAVAKAINYQPE